MDEEASPNARFMDGTERDPSRGSLRSFGDEKMSPQDDSDQMTVK